MLIILDGFGFNAATEARVLDAVRARLPLATAETALAAMRAAAPQVSLPREALLRLALAPVLLTVAGRPEYTGVEWDLLARLYTAARSALTETQGSGESLLACCDALVQQEALRGRYSIWAASSPYLQALRNEYPTVVTRTSGLAAGYEDVDPAVQGNSETGHQQIGNFIVAAQTPLEISTEIESGAFFENAALCECLEQVRERGSNLDIAFLLSGEYGNDGRVHSAWNHLEALCEAVFVRAKLPPARVRVQAILDGRDSPPRSSIERKGDRYGFLFKLKDLLARHDAVASLAWVVGRSIAMDRDYEEERARQDFDLLVQGKGQQVADFDAAIEAVRAAHAAGRTDTNVPPIAVGSPPRHIDPHDCFLDLNFRADRQREKVASLLGAGDFLQHEAGAKGRTWRLDWLQPPPGLTVYCLSDYHPDFAARYGARILYSTRPQAHNLFALLPEAARGHFPFHYRLTAESTKALHVGYFIRGRRERPAVAEDEQRQIVPSYGEEYGIATDDDYYKTPQMRAFALTDIVVEALAGRGDDLIAVNLSNTDMIGHLLPRRFDAAVRSVTLIDAVLATIVPAALRNGYTVVLTADHGNVEDDDASHTVNDVLTSFIAPEQELRLRQDPARPARLFDIPWSIVEIMGLNDAVLPHLPPIPEGVKRQGLVGQSLVEVTSAQARR